MKLKKKNSEHCIFGYLGHHELTRISTVAPQFAPVMPFPPVVFADFSFMSEWRKNATYQNITPTSPSEWTSLRHQELAESIHPGTHPSAHTWTPLLSPRHLLRLQAGGSVLPQYRWVRKASVTFTAHRPSLSLNHFFQTCLKFEPFRICFKAQHVIKPAFSFGFLSPAAFFTSKASS